MKTLKDASPLPQNSLTLQLITAPSFYESWDFGDDASSTQSDPIHTYTDAGLWSVSLEVTTAEGCKDSASTSNYILVHPKPNALFRVTPHQINIINAEIQITNVTSGLETSEYVISPPGTSLFGFDHDYEFDDTLTYNITQYVSTEFGCMDTISQSLKVEPVYNFYIPTGFTPNKDGINETWIPEGEGIMSFEMWITDRWTGETMYFTRSLDEPWDGTFKGKQVPQGVYGYRIEIWDVLGEPHEYFGKSKLSRSIKIHSQIFQ